MKKIFLLFFTVALLFSCVKKTPTKSVTKKSIIAVIVFDNASQNTYQKALPILQKYHISATAGIVTSKIGQSGFMDWSELSALQNNYKWEIASESFHGDDLESLYDDDLIRELTLSKDSLQTHGLNIYTLIPPNGNISIRQEPIISEYYNNIILCGTTNLNTPPILRYRLWSFGIKNSLSIKDISDRIDLAEDNNEPFMIFQFSKIIDNPTNETDITPLFFTAILDKLKENNIRIFTLSKTINKILGENNYAKEYK